MGQRTYSTFDPKCQIVVERADVPWQSDCRLIVSEGTQRVSRPIDTDTMISMMRLFAYVVQARTGELPTLGNEQQMFADIKVLDASQQDKLYMATCRKALDRRDGLTPVKSPTVERVRVRQRAPEATTPPVTSPEPVYRQRIRNR